LHAPAAVLAVAAARRRCGRELVAKRLRGSAGGAVGRASAPVLVGGSTAAPCRRRCRRRSGSFHALPRLRAYRGRPEAPQLRRLQRRRGGVVPPARLHRGGVWT
jgi:hypothetical protein